MQRRVPGFCSNSAGMCVHTNPATSEDSQDSHTRPLGGFPGHPPTNAPNCTAASYLQHGTRDGPLNETTASRRTLNVTDDGYIKPDTDGIRGRSGVLPRRPPAGEPRVLLHRPREGGQRYLLHAPRARHARHLLRGQDGQGLGRERRGPASGMRVYLRGVVAGITGDKTQRRVL